MVSADNRLGLYITVPAYFFLLMLCAWWGHRRMVKLENEGTAAAISAHYLGGRQFGWIVTAGTFFASLFSGYTVVGVPNDAFKNGFFITWWIPSLMAVVAGCFGTGLRLRKCSNLREHQSPVDFITDRFQSQLLRYTIVFLQVFPGTLYLTAQVIAIKGTFNGIFELDPDTAYPVIIIMLLILGFEWAGGLSSVAICDTIQAVVMTLSFIVIPSVIKKNFGGWTDIDLSTYPRPDFFQTFDSETQWSFWQLSIINFSFFTLPHLLQRNYSAKNVQALKAGYYVMAIGPWFTTFVGVFMGTIGVAMLGEGANPANPFSAILEEVMNLGGLAYGAGVITFTASLAAIMSTADSLIIAVSQLVTMEIIRPAVGFQGINHEAQLTHYAKFVSLGTVALALVIGIVWDEGKSSSRVSQFSRRIFPSLTACLPVPVVLPSGITDLGKIQFPLSAQAVPAFLYGLFITKAKYDIHPWSIAVGAWVAVVYVLGFYFGYLDRASDPRAVNAGISGLLVNVVVTISTEVLRRTVYGESGNPTEGDHAVTRAEDEEKDHTALLLFAERPNWDIPSLSRFGDHALAPELIWKSMEGVPEPMTNLWWVFFFFTTITLCTPLTPENEPPITAEGTFLWAPALIRGLPWWYFKLLMISAVSTLILLVAIFKAPDEFPKVRGDHLVMKRRETDNVSFSPYDNKEFVQGESFIFNEDSDEKDAKKKVVISDKIISDEESA